MKLAPASLLSVNVCLKDVYLVTIIVIDLTYFVAYMSSGRVVPVNHLCQGGAYPRPSSSYEAQTIVLRFST